MRGARVNGTDGLAVASGVRLRVAALAAVLAGCLALVFSSPALALIHRGHEFTGSIGAGALSGPDDVAVNESTGDIYVLDAAHNRVMVYGKEHEFLQAWGAGVKTAGGKEFEVCNAPETCLPGTAGFGKGEFDDPVAIAVDNAPKSPSKGDVYVVANQSAKKAVMDKFNPTGTLLSRLFTSKEERERFEENRIVGVAVEPTTGMVWVDREAEEEELIVQRLGNGSENKEVGVPAELELEGVHGPARWGLALDGKGNAYITYEPGGHTLEEQEEEEETIKEEAGERKRNGEPPQTPQLPCEKHACLTVKLAIKPVGESLEASNLVNPVDAFNTRGIALDPSTGDVYLDHVTAVSALTSRGALSQSFGSEQLGTPPSSGQGLAVDSATNEVFVADAGKGVLDVYGPSKPAPPEINPNSPHLAKATAETATLVAGIDPRGTKSHYRFEYGLEPCSASPCKQGPSTELPAGFGETTVTQEFTGLTPATKYFARLTVEYEEEGTATTATVVSQEHTFATPPATSEAELPDHRAWELVSPVEKNGASVEPSQAAGGVAQAAADGMGLTYDVSASVCNEAEGYRGPEPSQVIAARGPNGWSCEDIATRNTEGVGAHANEPRVYQFFSSDLSTALLDPLDPVPLSNKTTEKSVYLRHNLTCPQEPENCFEPLVTNENGGAFKGGRSHLKIMGATANDKDVIIAAHLDKLQTEAPEDGLYEWSEGQLTLVSILPGGAPTTEQSWLGAGDEQEGNARNHMMITALSHDGNRVEWYEGQNGEHKENSGGGNPHLYMREIQQKETLQVDELEEGLAAPKNSQLGALFQTANTDGSKVFFTDAARLTSASRAGENPTEPDLYVFEPEQPAGHRVTDLTVPLNTGEHAAVRGAVVGTSEDGSVVYFVANGVLAAGAEPGSCGQPLGSCNLYVKHDVEGKWEAPQFIARLSNRDGPDWGLPEGERIEDYRLEYKTSEVSGNGQYVAFMSENSLTGYDNTDVTGEARDEEVFLYNDGGEGSAKLSCVSCNPSGEAPVGLHDQLGGAEVLVDLPETWTSKYTETAEWLAGSLPGWTAFGTQEANYQPRYLNDQGRLFFNSPDALVPTAVNKGVENVYEYEPVGVGTCASANTSNGCVALLTDGKSDQESVFLDASESGNDVFFITSSKLVTKDADTAADIYDARVCGVEGAEACPSQPPPPPTECSGEACKSAPQGELSDFASAGSAAVGPSGNTVQTQVLGTTTTKTPTSKPKTPTKAELLAKALKTCHKIKSKKKRASCEKTARKKYGAKKASKAKHSTLLRSLPASRKATGR